MIATHITDNVLLYRMHKGFLPIYKKEKQPNVKLKKVKQKKECARKKMRTATLQRRI